MTRGIQKQDELRFAEEAARLMDMPWQFESRDETVGGPDFIVYEGKKAFGLEVHEIFSGNVSSKYGSRRKQHQAETQKLIDEIRRRYEEVEKDGPLSVRFFGTLDGTDIAMVVNALLNISLQEKSSPQYNELELPQNSRHLKILFRSLPDGWPRDRLIRPDWFSVMDSAGWVEKSTRKILDAVATKSAIITQYRRNIAAQLNLGDPDDADIRLLIVADRMWNYGQIAEPSGKLVGNLHGFNAVYFFPFPERPINVKSALHRVF